MKKLNKRLSNKIYHNKIQQNINIKFNLIK